uniref:AIG1-type G domain-containing protein n=1 Tax=Maylandia zebra TaxID=106582 RepID=A0A3P9C8P3_9CICH
LASPPTPGLAGLSRSSIKSDSPSVFQLRLTAVHMSMHGCRKFNFGDESTRQNRTIMLLGATGSGKSTLIDGMINYIVGVNWKDSFRFKLINEDQSKSQAHSQTSEVTVYKINHQEGFQIPFSLTIIDTPGFGDTRGIERDREIVEQIHNLFSDQHGVTDIDAVCFVAEASLPRLTAAQKYVFDSVLSIFGNNVEENIWILVTCADGQHPPVLEAINALKVPCPKTQDGLPYHFNFNNSALFAQNESFERVSRSDVGKGGRFDQMFWEMGTESMKRFFAALNLLETKSLTLTKEVLTERKQLEITVENLQEQVKLRLAKIEEINETSERLKEHQAEISRNENFEFEVTVPKIIQKSILGKKEYVTNCSECGVTCHYPCQIPDDASKRGCYGIGSDGRCTQCQGKCSWDVHHNIPFPWEFNRLKRKQHRKKMVKLMEWSSKCLNRLREIALKPNPLSTPEYIDMLIEGEKYEGKPGWKRRVQSLMEMKEKAELMHAGPCVLHEGVGVLHNWYWGAKQRFCLR